MAISGAQASATAASGSVDFPKYVGVATLKIMAVNPNNAVLKTLGWNIKDDADEPSYVSDKTMEDGTIKRTTKVRFMVQIQELEDKPIIPLDFFIGPEVMQARDGKIKVIDRFGRDAWGQPDIVNARKKIYYNSRTTGQIIPAIIDDKYELCHRGELELVRFLMKFLAMKPLQYKDRKTGEWVNNPDPGSLTIDNWKALVNGDFREIRGYVQSQKDNAIKVVLGVENNGDKSFQSFYKEKFLSPAQFDSNGVYTSLSAELKDYMEQRPSFTLSDRVVYEIKVTPTEVSAPSAPSYTPEPAAAAPASAYQPSYASSSLDPQDDDLPF